MKELDLTDPKWAIPIDELQEQTSFDVVTLEQLLDQRIRPCFKNQAAYKMNCKTIMRLLGIPDPQAPLLRRCTDYLKKNGFVRSNRDKCYWVEFVPCRTPSRELRVI